MNATSTSSVPEDVARLGVLLNGLVGGGAAGILFLAWRVALYMYKNFNHKSCRSRCCGKLIETSIDIGHTPQALKASAAAALSELEEANSEVFVPMPPPHRVLPPPPAAIQARDLVLAIPPNDPNSAIYADYVSKLRQPRRRTPPSNLPSKSILVAAPPDILEETEP